MSVTLGGNVCVRNGIQLDYCWREAVASLLPVCNTVTICDGESTDGTREAILDWCMREPRLRTCTYKWPPASMGTCDFWVDWINFCREHIREDFQFQLDADEVLCPSAYPTVQWFKASLSPDAPVALWCKRLNFWLDAHHLVPEGNLCGYRVLRFAPTSMWLPSDAPHPKAEKTIAAGHEPEHTIHIFHYGFLRRPTAFAEKSCNCRHYFFNTQFVNRANRQITDAMAQPGNWMANLRGFDWTDRLVGYAGGHPAQMAQWLKDRNRYDT